MLFLVGDTGDLKHIAWLQSQGWSRMWISRGIKPYPGEKWGFDNGAYRDWIKGKAFNETFFLRQMDKAYAAGLPYLAVVPDLVAQGLRSLEFSLSWLDRLPHDWPWYLAVQDGMGLEEVEAVIRHFSGLFLGGSNRFKCTAWYWSQLAHAHGKHFHYARCGTEKKIRQAYFIGADSCDSAFPFWIKERREQVTRFFQRIEAQPFLLNARAMSIHP